MFVLQVFLSCCIASLSLGYRLDRERVERGALEGIVISGGKGANSAVEIYIPAQGPYPSFQCQMFPMPASRFRHSQKGLMACGGGSDAEQRSCITWADGQWVVTHELERTRYEHSAFESDEGLMLMGSTDYPGSIFSIILDQDPVLGDDEPDSHRSYDLKYGITSACAIQEPETNTVVITGGRGGGQGDVVVRYGQNGWLADLPSLNDARLQHACGSYYLEDQTKVMLVAGGNGDPDLGYQYAGLSVEIRVGDRDSPWVRTTSLPSAVEASRIATLNNIIYHMGGGRPADGYRPEIHRWDAENEEWVFVDNLLRGRNSHAVSTVVVDDSILNYCFTK